MSNTHDTSPLRLSADMTPNVTITEVELLRGAIRETTQRLERAEAEYAASIQQMGLERDEALAELATVKRHLARAQTAEAEVISAEAVLREIADMGCEWPSHVCDGPELHDHAICGPCRARRWLEGR